MITRNSDNLALYGDDWLLTYGKGAFNSKTNTYDSDLNPDNATYHEIPQPKIWSGGWYTVTDGVLAANETGTAAIILAITKEIKTATQKRLDDFAFTREYRSIGSAAGYAGSHVSRFNSDGVYCKRVESDTWRILYDILDEVEAGTRDIPGGYNEIESELPVLAWPV